jgi:hypothetical protein
MTTWEPALMRHPFRKRGKSVAHLTLRDQENNIYIERTIKA